MRPEWGLAVLLLGVGAAACTESHEEGGCHFEGEDLEVGDVVYLCDGCDPCECIGNDRLLCTAESRTHRDGGVP
jgi:hypothetical protein